MGTKLDKAINLLSYKKNSSRKLYCQVLTNIVLSRVWQNAVHLEWELGRDLRHLKGHRVLDQELITCWVKCSHQINRLLRKDKDNTSKISLNKVRGFLDHNIYLGHLINQVHQFTNLGMNLVWLRQNRVKCQDQWTTSQTRQQRRSEVQLSASSPVIEVYRRVHQKRDRYHQVPANTTHINNSHRLWRDPSP